MRDNHIGSCCPSGSDDSGKSWKMAAYAIGFSLPLTVIILGVSFGKSIIKTRKTETVIRFVCGVLLIVAGFYFFATI